MINSKAKYKYRSVSFPPGMLDKLQQIANNQTNGNISRLIVLELEKLIKRNEKTKEIRP